jgi:AbrB family looped-hinge helix DNA binding protein
MTGKWIVAILVAAPCFHWRVGSIERVGDDMARTRVSPKFQVVIPKEIRERHSLKVGQEMQVISKGNTITLVPDRPLSAFRGILRGMPTTGFREKKDRRL